MSAEPLIRRFASLPSTNTAIAADAAELAHGTVYITDDQTAGRGQRGNTWEAEPGRNLTFSMLLRPQAIAPAQAFAVSMLTSLSIASVLSDWLQMEVLIKWPNDMYVGDRKLCGILIENAFTASGIEHAIIGVGINVNQQRFLSDAPNPVSMYQLTGRNFDLGALLADITRRILADYEQYAAAPDIEALTARYRAHQWRGTGIHRWHDHLRHEDIAAAIAHIAPDGTLTLATTPPRSYAFKQLSPIL